jgi:seryl-tRNA synthetase
MLDLHFIREHPDIVRNGIARKGEVAPIDEILALDQERRSLLKEVEALRARRNEVSKQIPKMPDGHEKERLIAEMRQVGDRIQVLDGRLRDLEKELEGLLLLVPNLPHHSVPFGRSEADNVVVRYWGQPREFHFQPLPHWELGESLDIIDFERGVKISGPRFYVLKGAGAKLERALINFMIDLHTERHGYKEVYPPFLVKREAMIGTGQLPKFEDDMYLCCRDDLFLNPTAEVPVTNLYRDEILPPGSLPIYHVGFTACFRREAGAGGRDTRGVIRVHQFDKVELVKFVEPHTSYQELESLVQDAADVLEALELPYRVVEMCTADLGFTAAKKYDLEVWMPGQGRYVEISSCSNFEAFQARRANIRYRPALGAKPEFVHTLNGSGLAVGRAWAALLENYQQPDGSITIPPALRPYYGRETLL